MYRELLYAAALGTAGAALAQTDTRAPSGETPPVTTTVVTPGTPPATVVTPVGPNTAVVTPVPGTVNVTMMKIQTFSDYDINDDGAYSPMEFAQALAFLANVTTGAGAADLPAKDKFVHKGMIGKMQPKQAVALLNATADEFSAVDGNNDWRITPDELQAAAMM